MNHESTVVHVPDEAFENMRKILLSRTNILSLKLFLPLRISRGPYFRFIILENLSQPSYLDDSVPSTHNG